MKKKLLSLVMIFVMQQALYAKPQASTMTIQSKQEQQQKMPLLLGVVGKHTAELDEFARYIKIMLDRTNQRTSGFKVTVKSFEKVPTTKQVKQMAVDGFPLSVFITESADNFLEWRMYDTKVASMVRGKRFAKQDMPVRCRAELLAGQLWPLLTGQEGFFTSRIAFCKEVQGEKKRARTICLAPPYADPAQSLYNEFCTPLVEKGRAFALRWNKDSISPLLLYSEATRSNIRLMSVDLHKQRKLVSNFDGFNMLPSFSADSKRVIYCRSLNGKSQLYVCEQKDDESLVRPITANNGNNVCPTLCENGDIIFCSDAYKKGPQVCYYHAFTEQTEVLTDGDHCVSPAYCAKSGKIAYSAFVDGAMQIFVYDMKTKKSEQVTFDKNHKEECTWSPCGNYLAFTVQTGSASRIAVLNLVTQERTFLTSAQDRCNHPAWSPAYKVPLVVS
ncbi:MAG: hypothetical protein AB7R69_01005 [Candidatus Babeliales bacterium]